ncbi:metallophosphoesterase, partial [Candidatus Omnitrophota bacterium]
FIESFRPKDKTYCILGNSDYYVAAHLAATLQKRSIKKPAILLRNAIISTELNGETITIAGIDDPIKKHDDLKLFNDLKNYPGFKLALIHSVLEFPDVETHNAHLILAGHTHGGQLNIFPENIMLRWVRSAYKKKIKYLGGFHKEDSTWINVSRGIGMSALPLRFRSRPEITILDLISS